NTHWDGVEAVAFSPNGDQLLSGGGDEAVKLWDAGSGQLVREFKGHVDRVNSVAFSRDSARLFSTADTTVKIWNRVTGEEMAILLTAPGNEWLSITPNGFFAGSPKSDALL